MKNFKRILSLALAVMMVIGGLVIAPMNAKASSTYNLVPGEINAFEACIGDEGGNFVLVAKSGDKYYALGAPEPSGTYTSTWISGVEVNYSEAEGLTATGASEIPEWTIKMTDRDTITIGWVEDTTTEYLSYPGSSTKFTIPAPTTVDTENGTEEWKITKGAEGLFNIITYKVSTRGIFFQTSSGRFGAYSTSNTDGYITDLMVFYKGTIPSYEPDPAEFATPEEAVTAAYELDKGEILYGVTLTGKITEIDTAYSESYKNISVVIQVGDMVDKPILCYRMKGADADKLTPGDTITVTGNITNYNGTIEFDAGCQFTDLTKGTLTNITVPTGATQAEIIELMKEAEVGVSALGNQTLKGVVKEITKAYEKKYVTFTMEVEGTVVEFSNVYGTEGEAIAVGDTVTLTGKLIKSATGVRMDNGSIDEHEVPTPAPDTGEFSLIGACAVFAVSALALAIVEFKKRR